MIIDPRVFHDDHLPREFKHRESEVATLCRALEPTLRGDPGNNALIAGPSGVGKTALAKHTLRKLRGQAAVPTAHIRGVGVTRGQLLREALRQYPGGADPSRKAPVEDVVTELKRVVNSPYVIVVDEAGDLADAPGLRDLVQLSTSTVIVIVHDPEAWLAGADRIVRDRMGPRIDVDRFTTAELVDILRARAGPGLAGDPVTDAQLATIANEVAGVARDGIQSLRAAAEIAGERRHETIRDDDIADSFARARRRIREANLQSLAFHHLVLYAIIHEAGPEGLTADRLHERYDAVADRTYRELPKSPIVRRTRRNRLQKLAEYDLIEIEGEGRRRHYRVRDPEVEPPVELPEVPA